MFPFSSHSFLVALALSFQKQPISYSLLINPSSLFSIQQETGEISLTRVLDYESDQHRYLLLVRASESQDSLSSAAEVGPLELPCSGFSELQCGGMSCGTKHWAELVCGGSAELNYPELYCVGLLAEPEALGRTQDRLEGLYPQGGLGASKHPLEQAKDSGLGNRGLF